MAARKGPFRFDHRFPMKENSHCLVACKVFNCNRVTAQLRGQKLVFTSIFNHHAVARLKNKSFPSYLQS